MGVVILKTNGMPVELDSSFTGVNKFDVNGFLVEFTRQDVYKYYQTGDFKKTDKEDMTDLEGYYKETDYLKYIQNLEFSLSIVELKGTKFNFEIYKAKVGDSVTVKVVDFEAPYEFFYKEKTYKFNIETAIDGSDVKYYKVAVYQGSRLIYWKVNIPPDIVPGINSVNLLTTPPGYFYTKNFGTDVNGWMVTATEKSNIKQMATLIAFKIYYIEQEIIKKILTPQELSVIEAEANSRAGDVTTLTDLELFVFNLKKSWGYFYAPNSDPSYIHRHSFDKVLSGNPDYAEYRRYYLCLVDFYVSVYPKRDLLLLYVQKYRLEIILKLISANGLNAAIPYEIRKSIIKDFLKQKDITEEDERFIVKLILSIDKSKADDFLDFLLIMQDGRTTTFEGVYNLLDDARLERYTVVNWFVDEETNRKYFVFAVYELWKVSKYNIQYVPSGTVLIDDVDINPNAYFIQHADEFIFDNILGFSTTDASSGGTLQDIEVSFESSFNGKRIKVNKKEQKIQFIETSGEFSTVTKLRLPAKMELFGNFHMYQSISLSGYDVNFDLKIPEKSNIPVFLFHYIKEYDELADFDAGVTLAIDLTIEAVLFYFTGGASILKDLRYLKHLTQLGRALRGTLPSSQAITVWRGLERSSEVFTLSVGALTAINEYLISTETDPVKRAFKEKVRLLFLGLLMAGAGTSILSRSRSVREATKILDDIAALPSGVAHGLSDNIILLLNRLKGNRVVSTELFANRLNQLNLDNLLNRYTSFSDDLKLAFWNDFKALDNVKDVGGLIELNKKVQYVDNWLDLRSIGALQEAKTIDFLIDQKLVAGIKRYYQESELQEIIKGFNYNKRKNFLNDLGEITSLEFNKLINNPNIVAAWGKFYDDSLLMSYLNKLSKSDKLEFLEVFGADEFLVFKLKKHPTYIDYWSALSQTERNLVKLHKLESIVAVELDSFLIKSGALRNPGRKLNVNEDILLTILEGLQTLRFSKFLNPILGTHRDGPTTYLWTIDQRGLNIALESTYMPTDRGNIVHSNLSSKAYIGGEAWFTSESKVIINAGSGRFGYGTDGKASYEQWNLAIAYWHNLGYEVESIKFNKR
ncbi:hypothetical protein [Pedobacter nyackensis]|uniref:Uncharacterized protein n=1 Tax=Pedobacter nyackensis TaxID=475255 RepID=A0A1W2A1S9_9SPHI|nr:hypothetical protein [Pedobacter nyackensis]SMC54258.1 hypothetical protein SAMN04488101_101231 [Pedobacter nyackensis]